MSKDQSDKSDFSIADVSKPVAVTPDWRPRLAEELGLDNSVGITPYSSPMSSLSLLPRVPSFADQHETYSKETSNNSTTSTPGTPVRAPTSLQIQKQVSPIGINYDDPVSPFRPSPHKSRQNRIISANQSNDTDTPEEMFELRQMVIDMKIQMCKVREEMGIQNAELKADLADIKKMLLKLSK